MPEKKKTTKKPAAKKPAAKKTATKKKVVAKYFGAVGRRKTSVARVRFFDDGKKNIVVNDKDYKEYFPTYEMHEIVASPLEVMNIEGKYMISVKVKGGGLHSQAEATRHGLSRALIKFNPEFRKRLKKAGFLTRDPRMRERKKFGKKRARKSSQWSKR